MTVSLRPMTAEEFILYEDADTHRYADAMVKAGYWSADDSLKRAKETHEKLLPQGVNTKDHFLFVIETPEETQSIGVIWFFVDHDKTPPSGFIYDLIIYERYRRHGFGKQAILALEDKARELGLTSLALHVFDDNEPAKALYSKLGYQVKSSNMKKALSPSTQLKNSQ